MLAACIHVKVVFELNEFVKFQWYCNNFKCITKRASIKMEKSFENQLFRKKTQQETEKIKDRRSEL